jgi:geranylgeranyl diphosphate synthase type II
MDDVLDVVGDTKTLGKPAGSDEAMGKTTYPSLVGLERSKELADACIQEALERISPYNGKEKEFLSTLSSYIVDRVC